MMRRAGLAICLVLAAVGAPACTASNVVSSDGAAAPGVVVVMGAPATSLNPYTPVLSSRQLGALIFRGLFAVDEEGMPTPDLSIGVPTKANGGMSEDGLLITYELDPEASWHDGEPVTAADVVFTWELLESGVLADEPSVSLGAVDAVRAIDEHTVELALNSPDAPLAWRFIPFVLPEHLLRGSEDLLSDPFWYRPVGCGPYSVRETQAGASAVLESVAGDGPAVLEIRFIEDPTVAREIWDEAGAAVWLDPAIGPAGAETYAETASTVWRAFLFNAASDRGTASVSVREALSLITTPVAPAGPTGLSLEVPTPGPYGQTWSPVAPAPAAAAAALGGARPDIRFIVSEIEPDEDLRIQGVLAAWRSLGLEVGQNIEGEAAFQAGYPGGGSLWTGDYDVAWIDVPFGQPPGWAWPFAADDVPAADLPLGLNVSRIEDQELEAARAAMAQAGDPDELAEAATLAWGRIEELRLLHLEGPLPTGLLSRGVAGVKPHPIPTEALRDALNWSMMGDTGGDAS